MNFSIIKKHQIIILWALFFYFTFFIYAYFNSIVLNPSQDLLNTPNANNLVKLNSPDETANYFWINKYATDKELYYFEPLNHPATNLIHLRSMNTVQGKITHGSFLGMPIIYGFLSNIFGLWIIPYLTPLFSVVALLFFYLIINYLFKNRSLATISTILLAFFPAWIYYSARGFYHNILFLSLSLIGIYYLFISFKSRSTKAKNKYIHPSLAYYALAGIFIGLSITVRTSEIVWLALSVVLIFAFNLRRTQLAGFLIFILSLWLPALLLLYHNQILYGAFISAGYKAVIGEGGVGEALRRGIIFKILISPFGINLKSIVINGWNYLYRLLPYWSLSAVLGGMLFITLPKYITKLNYKIRFKYVSYLLLVTGYLLLFYGSWQFSDRIDQQTLSLGTSYLRYWLPIYMLAIPLIAYLIYQLSNFLNCKKFRYGRLYSKAFIVILVSALILPSINLTFRKTDESLIMLKNLSEYRVKSSRVNQLTQPQDVILTYPQADKIFYPQRRHIVTALVVPADYHAIARTAKIRQIYYYTYAPTSTVAFISKRDFEPYGMRLINGQRVLGRDWIYQVEVK